MATKIRLARIGTKGKPCFRIVVGDERTQRGGKVSEILGLYDPQTKPEKLVINKERVEFWQRRGAQISPSLKRLLK